MKQAAPGNDWAMGQGHEVRFDYQTNGSNEVRQFEATTNWNIAGLVYQIGFVTNGYYAQNQLYKTITKDENWVGGKNNTTEEFKDKEGHVVLKRTYSNYTDITGTLLGSEVKHDTYYVYDDYGNLTYVLPPLVDTTTAVTPTILDDLCYQYKYDHRNRLVEKKLPGKQLEYIVYNSQDKPIATGPALNPFGSSGGGWLITKYDVFGRVVYTGWYQSTVDSNSRVSFQNNLSTGNWSEHFVSSPSTIDNFSVSYTNNTFPTTGFKILTVNYYDDYMYVNAPSDITSDVEDQGLLTGNFKGLSTGSWVRVLDNPATVVGDLSYVLYDKKARPIRNHTDNYLGGFTQVDTKLDFAGKTKYTVTTHKRDSSCVLLTVLDSYEYSDQDRLINHKQQINNLAIETIAVNTYDELGQLIIKDVGGQGTALQKVNYSYNIRGWLKTINDITNLHEGTDPTDLFAFKINYNDPIVNDENGSIIKLYNGNIAETNWKTSTDYVLRRYGYSYDNLNRLKKAVYQKPNESSNPVCHMYDESMTYDKNGNIQSLERYGDYDSNYYEVFGIDELSYVYDSDKKNQLMKVTDNSINPKGFKDEVADNLGNNTGITVNDYSYDGYGNMKTDDNKNITRIYYNHLNLPTEIQFGTGDKIQYLYDATGKKQRKIVTDDANIITTDYLDGFQYTNEVLRLFPHAEGYVSVTICEECQAGNQMRFNYVYQYKDHLGNIRVSYGYDQKAEVIKIIEENHYYPFGLKHTNYNSGKKLYAIDEEEGKMKLRQVTPTDGGFVGSNYKYNGKEYQDELGLNEYDYGARNYDPAIGRWMNIDPLAETSRRISPYAYALNNPVYFIDPDGMDEDAFDGWGLREDGQWEYSSTVTASNYSDKGYTDYAANGSVRAGASIVSADGTKGEDGSVYLGYDKNDFHYVDNRTIENENAREAQDGQEITEYDQDADHELSSQIFEGTQYLAAGTIIIGLGPEDPFADIAAGIEEVVGLSVAGITYLVEMGIAAYATETAIDSFAQRGNNDKRLESEELEKIAAKVAAGLATNAELQKLKAHEKATNQRGSRHNKGGKKR